MLQSKPFFELYDRLSNVDGQIGLITLRIHLNRLTRLFGMLDGGGYHPLWNGCWSNLNMAASLQGLDIDTDIHDDGLWCGPVSEFESAKSDIVGRFVAGRLTFEMVFHAYEVFGQHYCEKSRPVTAQEIARKLMAEKKYCPLRGLRNAASEAIHLLPVGFDFETQGARRAIAQGSWIGLGAENIRQFRNALVHGRIQAPDPVDWGKDAKDCTADEQTDLFRWQIRLCLLLIQIMCHRFAGSNIVEVADQEFSVEEVVFSLHMQDRYHDDEDDPDQPSLMGFEAAPRFHYW